ncbi:MAG TPA: MEDS domain-containing protein [Thermoanaerobaculia bacterium]|nr:MEDS domain-containing protein [Thermoanaerobaculia bacterium]
MRQALTLNERIARGAPGDHLAQLFATRGRMVETVAGFTEQGLNREQGVVLIVCAEHATALQRRLEELGVDVAAAGVAERLVYADAETLLAELTRGTDGEPDPTRFHHEVNQLIERAQAGSPRRQVRVFGEMVWLLQQQRRVHAAVTLENLWEETVDSRRIALLCGYAEFGPDGEPFPAELAAPHARVYRELSSRDRLLQAARQLFANGYDETTTAAIARHAGSSESQIVKHFGSKDGLLRALFENWWDGVLLRVDEVEAADLAPAETLIGCFEPLLTSMRDEQFARVLLFESRRQRRNDSALVSQGFLRYCAVLDRTLGRARLAEGLSVETARDLILGGFEGMVRGRLLASLTGFPAGYDFGELRTALRVLVTGLLGAEREG